MSGLDPTSAKTVPPARTLGRYEIHEEIGRGMMGVVYRAQDPVLGRAIALKAVRLAFALSEDERRAFERRFLAEARIAAALSHPGIVVVHDVGRDTETGTLFIALEYLQGRTLADLTAAGAPMEWRQALRTTQGLAETLHHAHGHGIVHRDIKPANVMILPSGEPKIMDFGIAKVPAAQLTSAGEFFGTPSYMSPEQASGDPVDGRSDLFSLGSVLYLLLTGRRAFDADSVPAILARVATKDPPLPSSVFAGLPPEVDYVVSRALAKDPKARYPDGKTFAEDIEDILDGRPPRHRAGWQEPRRADQTLFSGGTVDEPETTDLRRELLPTVRTTAAADRDVTRAITPAARPPVRRPIVFGGLAALLMVVYALGPGAARVSPPDASPPPEPVAEPAAARTATPPPRRSNTTPVPPAWLALRLEHGLESGMLRVSVDNDLVLNLPLRGEPKRRLVFFRKHRGTLEKRLRLSPGEHVVRVQVEADGHASSRKITGKFRSGATRRLGVSVGNVADGELSVVWGS